MCVCVLFALTREERENEGEQDSSDLIKDTEPSSLTGMMFG